MSFSRGPRSWLHPIFFFLYLLPLPLLSEVYTVTEGSEVRYLVEHPLHDVIGIAREVTGGFSFDLTQPSNLQGLLGQTIRVRWDRFDSGNRNRDAHVLQAVRAPLYPEVTFRVTSLEGFSAEGGKGRATVIGILSLNGHSRSITVPVEFEAGDPATVTGRFTIRMTEFGIDPPSLLFLKAKDSVLIEFALKFAHRL